MKLLLIGPMPPLRGGISDFNNYLYLSIKKNHHINYQTPSPLYPSFLFPGQSQFQNNFKKIHKDKSFNPYNIFSLIKLIFWINKNDYDKLITTHWNPIFSIIFTIINLSVSNKIEKIGIIHNVNSHENNYLDKFFVKLYLYSLNRVVTLSKFTQKQIRNISKIETLPLFHPIPKLNQPLLNRNNELKKMKLDTSKTYLLHFGIIRPYKGLNRLIQIFNKVINRKKDLQLIIVGEFYENVQYYKTMIENLNLKNYVTVVNEYVEEKDFSKWFSISDYVVQINKSASQSGVTGLSIYFEKVIISNAVGGIKEILNKKNSVITKNDEISIEKTLSNLEAVDKESLINQIKFLKNELSWPIFCEKFLNFIKN